MHHGQQQQQQHPRQLMSPDFAVSPSRGRQWSPQRPPPPPPQAFIKLQQQQQQQHPRCSSNELKEIRKASTMDGDKKRLFLERMRAAGAFHNVLEHRGQGGRAGGGGGHRSRSSHETSTLLRPSEGSFYEGPPRFDLGAVKGAMLFSHSPNSGFRSLSSDAVRGSGGGVRGHALFDGDDDDHPPLQMSSIDANGGNGRPKGGNAKLRKNSHATAAVAVDPFLSVSGFESQFSLSTPDFGPQHQHQQQQAAPPPPPPQVKPELQLPSPAATSQQSVGEESSASSAAAAAATKLGRNASASNQHNSSYSSLRSKIKSVQERYKKASVSSKFRSKFGAGKNQPPPQQQQQEMTGAPMSQNSSQDAMTKYRSHSHGALHSLCEFEQKLQVEEEEEEENDDAKQSANAVQTESARDRRQQRLKAMMLRSAIAAHVQSKGNSNNSSAVTTVTIEAGNSNIKEAEAAALPLSSKSSSDETPPASAFDSDHAVIDLASAASDSLSSGSDSGFYHTSATSSTDKRAHHGSPRYSICSSRCSSSSGSATTQHTGNGGNTSPRRTSR